MSSHAFGSLALVLGLSMPLLAHAAPIAECVSEPSLPPAVCGHLTPSASGGVMVRATLPANLASAGRTFDLYIPSNYRPNVATALVLDFHGYPECPTSQKNISCWSQQADLGGFLVAYPRGIDNGFFADPFGGLLPSGRDVQFARDIVTWAKGCMQLDAARVYASGYSGGGAMTHRIGCDAADVFSGIAAVSYGSVYANPAQCAYQRPIPVLEVRGFTDTNVFYCTPVPLSATAAQSLDCWRTRMSVPTNATPRNFGPLTGANAWNFYCDDARAGHVPPIGVCDSYLGNSHGATELVQCSVHGLLAPLPADQYTSKDAMSRHRVYKSQEQLNVCQQAWDLFQRNPLPPPP